MDETDTACEHRPGAAGQQLLGEVSRLVDAALAIDFRVGDETGSLSLAALSAPSIVQLLRQTRTVLLKIQDYYEAARLVDASIEGSSLDDIGALISTEVAAQEIRDLSFVADAQIRSCLKVLRVSVASQNVLHMVSGSDDALCRMRRVLIPIEGAIAEYEGLTPPPREWGDLQISLQIRRLYGRLRRELLAVGEPEDDELESRLREFAGRLAGLRSVDIYTFLRVSDRFQMRALQRRILTWLDEEPSPSIARGRRLWQDLAIFLSILREANKRQELLEHDRLVIAHAYHSLYVSVRPPKVIPAEILDQLRNLEGLDDELDRLILQGTSRRLEDWEGPIRRLFEGSQQEQDERPSEKLAP